MRAAKAATCRWTWASQTAKSGEGLIGGDAGKSYLELQSAETDLLKAVEKNFEHVIVLVNSSHAMELGFLEDAGVDAALQIAGPGATGMRGVADVLLGKVNPSGHLVDTYAYDVKAPRPTTTWAIAITPITSNR